MTTPVEPPLRAMTHAGRRRPRTRRVAESLADDLRSEILGGELTEVPRLDVLLERFDVGPPAAREAMRILETEGLITVRRGNQGGADVHLPQADQVAYSIAMVLQSTATPLGDVGAALRELEPLCAVMCATRPDRAATIVPVLEALLVEQAEAIGDVARTLTIVDRFHGAIVDGCGNATLTLVVGALERVWAGHASAVYDRDDHEPSPRTWRDALRAHEKMVAQIKAGDVRVGDRARQHLEATHAFMSSVDDARRVTAADTTRGHESKGRR